MKKQTKSPKSPKSPNNYTIGQRIRYLRANGYTVIPPVVSQEATK